MADSLIEKPKRPEFLPLQDLNGEESQHRHGTSAIAIINRTPVFLVSGNRAGLLSQSSGRRSGLNSRTATTEEDELSCKSRELSEPEFVPASEGRYPFRDYDDEDQFEFHCIHGIQWLVFISTLILSIYISYAALSNRWTTGIILVLISIIAFGLMSTYLKSAYGLTIYGTSLTLWFMYIIKVQMITFKYVGAMSFFIALNMIAVIALLIGICSCFQFIILIISSQFFLWLPYLLFLHS